MRYEAVLASLEQSAPDLNRSLISIEAFVQNWWRVPYLPWFTDHGPAHSRRVTEYLLSMIPDALQPGTELTPIELYVACAAATAHDLGMQVLLERRAKLGELTASDYDAVRSEHPKQSFEVILNRAGDLGIPDDPQLVTAVGLVAQAHGTRFFLESVKKLSELQTVRNRPFRGALLAAMILMADELDLHYERAQKPDQSQATLNTTSQAHYYKHHYITMVRLVPNSVGELQIELELTFPKSVREQDRDTIIRWVTSKLRVQIGLVQTYLLEGLNGQLRLSRAIKATAKDEIAPLRSRIDADALHVIQEEAVGDQIIDYRLQRRSLLDALQSRRVIGVLGRSGQDLDGREDILDWLRLRLDQQCRVASSERLRSVRGGAASDVLSEWLSAFGRTPKSMAGEAQNRRALLNALVQCADDKPFAFTVSSTDNLRQSEQDWIFSRCLPRLIDAFPRSILVFTGDLDTVVQGSGDNLYLLRLGTPDSGEVIDYFRRFEDGPQGKIYVGSGVDYGTLKKLAVAHELNLAEATMR